MVQIYSEYLKCKKSITVREYNNLMPFTILPLCHSHCDFHHPWHFWKSLFLWMSVWGVIKKYSERCCPVCENMVECPYLSYSLNVSSCGSWPFSKFKMTMKGKWINSRHWIGSHDSAPEDTYKRGLQNCFRKWQAW